MGELEQWFEENKRDFPWRQDRSPYRVWISEVMLQQTRAAVVVPYFLKWMDLFPNVKALYMAPIEQVIKAWEGLGYYSRARNLHSAAKQIVEQFEGEIPSSRESLSAIRGFGPYTTGAVLSFGFRQRAVAVDGNVLRVAARSFLIEENIAKARARRRVEEKVEALLDRERPWITTEALIELGATICLPKPRCADCPLQKGCLARQAGKEEGLPIKDEERKIIVLRRMVLVLENEGAVLVKKGASGQVMADLYEFPYFEIGDDPWRRDGALNRARQLLRADAIFFRRLSEQRHTFTRFKAHLFPVWLKVKERPVVDGHEWVSFPHLSQIPFSSGHRKIAAELKD